VTVVSLHHSTYCIARLARRAHACDGVIEALEHEHHPWAIALQWHPELAIDDHAQQRIFHALVEAARAERYSY